MIDVPLDHRRKGYAKNGKNKENNNALLRSNDETKRHCATCIIETIHVRIPPSAIIHSSIAPSTLEFQFGCGRTINEIAVSAAPTNGSACGGWRGRIPAL